MQRSVGGHAVQKVVDSLEPHVKQLYFRDMRAIITRGKRYTDGRYRPIHDITTAADGEAEHRVDGAVVTRNPLLGTANPP